MVFFIITHCQAMADIKVNWVDCESLLNYPEQAAYIELISVVPKVYLYKIKYPDDS